MTAIDPSARRPTVGQDVAVARIEYALAEPGGVAVLCGPAGAGVSTVLQLVWQRCAVARGGLIAGSAAEARQLIECRRTASGVILVDDAHLAAEGELDRLVTIALAEPRLDGVVLAGQGRLLSLLHRSPRLDARVRIRAVLRPLTEEETAVIVRGRLPGLDCSPGAIRALHEIAAGILAEVVRLVDLAAVVGATDTARGIEAHDIEAIHCRLVTGAA
jgi:type II secretory pathway predicted ATPase ExeA